MLPTNAIDELLHQDEKAVLHQSLKHILRRSRIWNGISLIASATILSVGLIAYGMLHTDCKLAAVSGTTNGIQWQYVPDPSKLSDDELRSRLGIK